MAKTKKELVEEVVDKIMSENARYLVKEDDVGTFYRVRDFVTSEANLEYDRAMHLIHLMNNSEKTSDSSAEIKSKITREIENLNTTVDTNKSAMGKDQDERKRLGLMPNEREMEVKIFKDLLSKIIAPLIKKEIYAKLLETPLELKENAATAPPQTPSPTSKKDEMVKAVVDKIIASYGRMFSDQGEYAKKYLYDIAAKQFDLIQKRIHIKMRDKKMQNTEWVKNTKSEIKEEIDEALRPLKITTVDNTKKYMGLLSMMTSTDSKKSDLALEKDITLLIDVMRPLAEKKMLEEMQKVNKLTDLSPHLIIIPQKKAPTLPISITEARKQIARVKSKKTALPLEQKTAKKE